jgi:hypothetical protein
MFKKILNKAKIVWNLLFFGMKGADNAIFGRTESNGETVFERHDSAGGVFQDLLEQKVTQEVEELRDKNYRVLRESDLYDTSDIDLQMDSDGNITEFKNAKRLKKKTKYDFQKHTPVYDGENVLIIQDNRKFDSTTSNMSALYDYETLLDISRDGITPRFYLEKFITKIVIREHYCENKKYVDLYVPSEASQFGKIDAMLIANIYRMWSEQNYRSDITDFTGLEFISYKAWGTEDLFQYKFKKPTLIGIEIFDGSFVLVFDCETEIYGKYIPEKFKTESLDDKYKLKSPKSNTFSIDANNFKKKTFLK